MARKKQTSEASRPIWRKELRRIQSSYGGSKTSKSAQRKVPTLAPITLRQ